MRPPALRLRLLLAAAVSVSAAVIIAGIVIAFLFSNHVENAARMDLEAQLNRLAALIDTTATPLKLTQPMADPRYGVPLGGLYWQVTDPASGDVLRSRSLWDTALDLADKALLDGSVHATELMDPEGILAIALVRRLDFIGDNGQGRTLDLVVAEDRARIDAAIAAFRFDLGRALTILAIALVGAAWVQVTLGLRPLRAIERGINAIRSGQSTRLDGRFPAEVMPLVSQVNALLQTQESSIAFARARAADLAHGLKTSLAALNAETFALRRKGQAEPADAIEELSASMGETIDHQLRLSRLRVRSRANRYASPVGIAVSKVANALGKTPHGGRLEWTLDLPEGLIVDMDAPDLTELFGVLLDNACKWARKRVDVRGGISGNMGWVTISDDGPGLNDSDIERLGQRGLRLDQRKSGNGIGLAIARDVMEMNGGTLKFGRSERLGGLEVRVGLPLHLPLPETGNRGHPLELG